MNVITRAIVLWSAYTKKDRLSDLQNRLFGITEYVNYPEIPDGWITTMQISTLDKYQKLIPSNSGNKNRKPQTYRKPDFSVLRRGYEGHCFGNKKPTEVRS
ncbi:hypothetical protein AZH52_03030 [Proteus mirabilis]|nr:hypothetical protein AZH52_03030 [Proteus mirabilis]